MTPVPRGPRTWMAGAMCALAVCGSVYSLSDLILPGRWLSAAIGSVLVLAAILATVRALTRVWWAPTAGGLVVLGFGLLAAYASPPGRFQWLPSAESLARLGDTFRAGLSYSNTSRPPVDPTFQLELLVVGGTLLVLLCTDLVALGLGSPAGSGLVLLTLWLPAIVIGRETSLLAFAGTGAGYLLLLALTAAPLPGSRSRGRADGAGRSDGARRAGATVAVVATVTVGAIVLGPVAAATPGWSTIRLPQIGSATAGSLRLARDLDMRESLGPRSGEVELTYLASPVLVGPLRVFTLRDFDGANWSRDDRATKVAADRGLLWPARDLANRPANEVKPTESNVTVVIKGLREEQLPVPVMPRTIDANGRWRYDAGRDEVDRVGVTRPGMTYTIRTELLALTPANLRAAGTSYPADLKRYLAVPRTSRTRNVTATAKKVTASATNHYDQALALQTYLRSPENFTYSTDVLVGRSDDAVWDFLGNRTGYCVQFATAMTVMARTLGIPARLAVGFLPGTIDKNGARVVTGRDSHAWPELYFPGAGWVRFEPTPSVQSGAPPQWADPFAALSGTPTQEGNPDIRGAVPGAAPTQAPQAGPVATTERTDSRLAFGVSGAIAILLLGVTGWFVRRRRSARSTEAGSEVAWSHLRARLARAGIMWSDARTPHQVTEIIAAQALARTGAPLRDEAQVALRELALAVQQDRYAPNPPARERGELETRVGVIVREITNPAKVPSPLTLTPTLTPSSKLRT